MKSVFFFILLTLLSATLQCECPSVSPDPPADKPLREIDNFKISEEIINGKNYGLQVRLGNYLFLQSSVSITKGYAAIGHGCPQGYDLPTEEEYQEIIKNITEEEAFKLFTDKENGLGMVQGKRYLTKTKKFPNKLSGSDLDSWTFKAVVIQNNKVNIGDSNTWGDGAMEGKCRRKNTDQYEFSYEEDQLIYGKQVVISLQSKNFKSILWRNGLEYSTKEQYIKTFKEYGCQRIEVWAKTIADNIVYSCKNIYIVNPFYNNKVSSFDMSKLKTVEFNTNIQQINAIFFNPSTAPIAPKLDGGFYIAFASRDDNGKIHVMNFDKKKKLIKDIDLGFQGNVLDIAATYWGFALLHSIGGVTLRFNGYFEDGSLRFSSLIYSNDDQPFKRKDQIKVWLGTGYLYGVHTMNHPYGGKVLFAKGQFVVAQYSYNSFDPQTDAASPNGHTGDVVFQFDENGENPKTAVVWSSSHTCIQSMIFTGKYIAYATLGDAFPKNMKAHIWDPTSKPAGTFDEINQKYIMLSTNSNSESMHEKIPANEAGNSCGRMGGLHFNGKKYALVYTVKPCEAKGEKTNLDEVGMITFDNVNGKPVNIQKKLLKGLSGVDIIQIRSGKYGRNILIFYMVHPTSCGGMCGWQGLRPIQTVYFVLADFDGNIVSGPFKSDKRVINWSDDIRELKDGSLIWSYIDGSGKLRYAYVRAP